MNNHKQFIKSLFCVTIALIYLSTTSFATTTINQLSPKDVEEDINFLLSQYESIHPNLYHSVKKVTIELQLNEIKKNSNTYKSKDDLFDVLSPLVQQFQDSHTYIAKTQFGQVIESSQKTNTTWPKENYYIITDDNIAILSIGSFNKNLNEFEYLLDECFTEMQDLKIQELIIDCRNNPGGDATLAKLLMEYIYEDRYRLVGAYGQKISKETLQLQLDKGWINQTTYEEQLGHIGEVQVTENIEETRLFDNKFSYDGAVYMLINENTRSAATMFAALLKDYNRAILIGQETGDKATGYTANYDFILPNSALRASVSWQYIARPSGLDTGHGVLPDYYSRDFDMDAMTIAKKIIALK